MMNGSDTNFIWKEADGLLCFLLCGDTNVTKETKRNKRDETRRDVTQTQNTTHNTQHTQHHDTITSQLPLVTRLQQLLYIVSLQVLWFRIALPRVTK